MKFYKAYCLTINKTYIKSIESEMEKYFIVGREVMPCDASAGLRLLLLFCNEVCLYTFAIALLIISCLVNSNLHDITIMKPNLSDWKISPFIDL